MQRILASALMRLAVIAAALTLQQAAQAQTRELATKGELLDRVAAIVNDGVVLNSELDAQVEAVSGRLRQQKLELPPQNVLRQRDVLQHISVTPREIDQFLEKQAKTPSERKEYNVSHILIAVAQEASPAQLEQAAKRAADVYQRAKGGEDFAKLAVAYSNSQTALEGGALGWRKGGELPTFLSDVIAALKPGEVSEPLRTPTGYHIIRLNEVRGATEKAVEDQIHVRHILMKTTELADDATVRLKLTALRERILKGEDFAGLAQTTSQDPGSAAEGGDLGWAGPGTFAPEFEQAIAGLKDNEISEPFHTQFGWHIAQVLGHRRFDNTDELKRRQAMEAIRAGKADEEAELWLRR